MVRTWKSYLAFTSSAYRILGLAVLPVLLLALTVFLGMETAGAVVVCFEILADFWLFSGILKKETGSMEYLKTSIYGTDIIKNGLVADCIRRFVYLGILSFAGYLSNGRLGSFTAGLSAYLTVMVLLNVSRHLSGIMMHLMVSYVGLIIYGILMEFISGTAAVVIMSFLAVIVSIVTVWYAMYCVKGSYYEKRYNESV